MKPFVYRCRKMLKAIDNILQQLELVKLCNVLERFESVLD